MFSVPSSALTDAAKKILSCLQPGEGDISCPSSSVFLCRNAGRCPQELLTRGDLYKHAVTMTATRLQGAR